MITARSPYASPTHKCADPRDKRIADLEVEIAAAKAFGGGFYGDKVTEGVRDAYRAEARKSKS
jgi:hypothetical protein